ncbi:AtpZ/AtpI family protein [bacterium]|nr:AtpZ/AtpI family protein [bacterium]
MTQSYKSVFSSIGELFYLGILLGVCISIGIGLGWLADKWLGISPFGVLAGIVFGIISAFVEGYRLLKKSFKKFEQDKIIEAKKKLHER